MDIGETNYPLSKNIRTIMKQRGLQQAAVARKAQIKAIVLNLMLKDKRVIKGADVFAIATALEVTPNDLFACPPRNEPT